MKKIIAKYDVGDMSAVYVLDDETMICAMILTPADMPFEFSDKRKIRRLHSLVQTKIIGDNYAGFYHGGETMSGSDTVYKLKYHSQKCDRRENNLTIKTVLKSDDGLMAVNTVEYLEGDEYISIETEIANESGRDVKCELLSAFSVSGISPYSENSGSEGQYLYRIRGKWSKEGRLVKDAFEDLQLEDEWCFSNGKCIRFGQVGSMPVKGYYPFAAIEDSKNKVFWGVQMGCPSSWQMEVSKSDAAASLCGGIADREFGHWMKTIKNGETFKSPRAVMTVCRTNIDDLCMRLVSAQERALNVPECEEELPIVFNEYCTTWGNPSEEKISEILNAIKDRGISYFVIDCGWYKTEGIPWDRSMGEYIPSEKLFPSGINNTVRKIKEHGMKAGIWFEFENIGPKCAMFDKTEHMLKRDGIPLTTQNRRFWDMTDPWVKDYLKHKVIDFMNDNGFEYIKVDYNETIGIGCDNEDSLGEGLRLNMLGTREFFKNIRENVKGVVIENCASGGQRTEPSFMALSSMASFSDAHECVEIPIIAASLHRVILPRQSQIWCVVRKNDSLRRIAYSVSACFLGRMCLSGDIAELSDEQQSMIDEGINFYKKAAPIIKNGRSRIYENLSASRRHPKGWQAVVRKGNGEILVTAHVFETETRGKIEIPVGKCRIKNVYPENKFDCAVIDDKLVINNTETFTGYGIILKEIL